MQIDPRAFLSYDFDHDDGARRLFSSRAVEKSPTPFVVQAWSCKEELDAARWDQLLAARLALCHVMVVLVGRHMATAQGVAREIDVAGHVGVPFFGVYVDGADTTSKLPAGLVRSRTILWNWNAIGTAIDRMMAEGKNAR